jgi:serine/threonine protein kinase
MYGKVLGNRYKIIEKLGGGGMAEVFKGLDTLLDRQVTIKILREQYTSDKEFVRKFRREAQAVARLSHPNIVSIYDVGIDGDTQYLVMEFVDGLNLKEYINSKGPLSDTEVIDIGIQICDALEHAHNNQIIHRDIKPHNILITKNGKVKVTDFGIARAATEATITYNGGLVGSVHYISPEQAKGELTEYKSDIYSAGVVLYEMATGKLPFEGESPITVALKHIQDTPKKPSELKPDIIKPLETVILKAMEREKEQRYSSAGEMKSNLERIKFREKSFVYQEKRPKKKLKPLGWVIIGLLSIGIIVGGLFIAGNLLEVGEVKVPNVIGKSIEEAGVILRKEGLVLNIGGEEYHPTIPKNHIINQSPKSDSIVRKGRKIDVDVSLGQKQVEVPDVIGDTLRVAKIKIENAGLVVSEEIEEVYSDEYSEGRIIGQTPLGGTYETEGTEVVLVLSKGAEPQYIDMPDLRGLPLAQAEKILDENSLDIGIISYDESTSYFTGQVISQDITPNEKILQRSTINLVVSRGPGPVAQTANVTMTVTNDGQEHVIKIVVDDRKGSHQEYLQRHLPGDHIKTSVTFYEKGIIKIYQDDVLIHEESVPPS